VAIFVAELHAAVLRLDYSVMHIYQLNVSRIEAVVFLSQF
jgi:hypothetical protein